MFVSPATVARIALVIALLSPFAALMVSNFRGWWAAVVTAALFVSAGIWIISDAIDTESAKNVDNLDLLLGYAIDFSIVAFSALVFAISFAVKGFAMAQRPRAAVTEP